MKKIMIIAAMLVSAGVFAQKTEAEPRFEKEGNLIKATYYHDNGTIAQTGFFKAGKLHGEWQSYDIEGKKVATGKYDKGQKTGKWFFWSGEQLNEVTFEDSRIVNVVAWSEAKPLVLNK
ncbi:toxin-antitoxin system YwqK family antitoxin [Sinomicrobium soli]|uniref:toxin-antitoxin system YwqK family antitoxin n=1 Tax=Sinomicrobium sp. N-1-3-6 TaxID=2219864 RepID=UPI000DCC7DC6|nr:nicotinic acid mononucleotide adenyltransferase [Sinomicrobium sp. N-1-3-6]RAV29710.1 nicotinic acid mononucleotide adenyltransferase [Sinomicrobium sp. N-1-3-6]